MRGEGDSNEQDVHKKTEKQLKLKIPPKTVFIDISYPLKKIEGYFFIFEAINIITRHNTLI
jgi:hypothetical protein